MPPVTNGAVALPPPPGMPWPPPAQSDLPVPPGYAPVLDYVPPTPVSSEQPGDEFARLRRGFHPGVSVGFTSMDGAVVAGGTASFIANFGVGRHVDLRASLRIGIGPGQSFGFGTNPYGVDGTLEVPLAARFNFGTVYTIVVGFSQGALFLNASDCNLVDAMGNSTSCGRSITPYYLFGPELSFTSFRMGPKREVELDILGGPQFIAPQSGVVFYPRVSVSVSYLLL